MCIAYDIAILLTSRKIHSPKKRHKLFLAKIEIEGYSSEIGRSTLSFHFYATLPEKDDCISSDSKMQADWCEVT